MKNNYTAIRCKRCGTTIDNTKPQLNMCKCKFVGVDNDGRIIGEPKDYEIIFEPNELSSND